MAISGQSNINIGTVNQASGSDTLFAAFEKTQNNFTRLFSAASPVTSFIVDAANVPPGGSAGISVISSNGNQVSFRNTGVTSIVAGTGVSVSAATGAVTISMAAAGAGGGTVTSVGLTSPNNTVTVSNVAGNIVASGVFNVDLAQIANVAGTYFNPNLTVDRYGRVTRIVSQTTIPDTVSSVTVTAGAGISVQPSGNATAPAFNIVNTGVRQVVAGTGISVQSTGDGVFTINALGGGGGGGGSVTTVTVRAGNNIAVGSAINNVSPGNTYSSATLASFALDLSNNITVNSVNANTVTVNNDSTFTGNITVSGNVSTIGNLTISTSMRVANTASLSIPSLTPANASASGITGQLAYDSAYLYICTSANTWRRIAHSTW